MRYRLGLDLGANSLGWAVLETDQKGEWHNAQPVGVVATGVRMFDAGVEGSIEQGKDSSRAAERRRARQARRQTWRRRYRKGQLFRLLQRLNSLPTTAGDDSVDRDAALKGLDDALTAKWCKPGDIAAHQKLPYLLRAAALEQLLEPFELGRAIYHLGQRRGYKANRKTDVPDSDDAGIVSAGISTLERARRRTPDDPDNVRTLAETVRDEFVQEHGRFVLRSEDPAAATRGRIRQRFTARQMYYDEFIRIRDAQLHYGCAIPMEDWKRIERILFTQRPLKSQKHLVGRCTLEFDRRGKGRRRCTIALPEFQEFRLLQAVNHLRITLPGEESQPLSDEQRHVLLNFLSTHGDLVLQHPKRRTKNAPEVSVESLLQLPRGTKFSLTEFRDGGDADEPEDGGNETKLIGDRTAAKLRPLLGERYDLLTDDERDQLILQVLYITNPESLKQLVIRKWGLAEEDAAALTQVSLEEGFGSLSRRAIRELLPYLRNGMSYAEARKTRYPESLIAAPPADLLPVLEDWNPDVRNPSVIRALTELRKVVNALIRKYGKPDRIHIELARDLKRSRKERLELTKRNDDRRKQREKAVRQILEELDVAAPRRDLVDKWLLAEECNWECPYTGKGISPRTLDYFDVEHIFPRQYLDDSFANKTLCDHDFNRSRKQNRLPAQVLSSDELDVVVARVKKFKGPLAAAKLRRFECEVVAEDFVSRQLNDTRYNSRLAADYLGLLYGGRSDADGHQRIITPTGNLTWILRTGWELNSILSDTDQKDRRDNRHHAIDAVCVAIATQRTISVAADLAKNNFLAGERFNRFLREMPKHTPWDHFSDSVRRSIEQIVVSHRPTRRIGGPLNADTNYSRPFDPPGGRPDSVVTGSGRTKKAAKPPAREYRVRKQLQNLTAQDIAGDAIVDPRVRAAVQEKYAELCATAKTKKDQNPLIIWSDRAKIENFPTLPPSEKRIRKGQQTFGSPIFKVRLRVTTKPRIVGQGPRTRYVASKKDSNYATMIYAIRDKSGKEVRWEQEVITRLDAHDRLSANGGGRARHRNKPATDEQQVVPERVLIPRTAAEIREMENPPFKLKPGETVHYQFALVKNDMVELDGPGGTRCIYRVQSFSVGEIMLCENARSTVTKADRTSLNRITTTSKLKERNILPVSVSPLGEVVHK